MSVSHQFRSEFKRVIGLADDVSVHSLMESWDLWQRRIIAYSMLERANRRNLKELIGKLTVMTRLKVSNRISKEGY